MVSAWIQHIKKVQKEKGISYKEAMKIASGSYQSSPGTKEKKHHKKRHTKRHRRKYRRKHRRSKHHRRRHRGGEHTAAHADEAPVTSKPPAEIGGTAAEGSSCTLPARSGSGSVTQADLLACSGASGTACGKAGGGHRKTRRRQHRKKRRTRRKTRGKRKRRRRR